MRVTVSAKLLLEAMAAPMAIAPSRSPKDVLKYVMLRATEGELSVTGADGEMMATVSIEADVEADGSCLIQPARLASVLREARDGSVTIQASDEKVTVKAGGRFEFHSAPVDDFPVFAEMEPKVTLRLSPDTLARGISRTTFCVDEQSTRYAMGGVFFDLEDNLHMVATDSRRMAAASVAATILKRGDGTDSALVVPTKALLALSKVLGDEEVAIEFSDRAMLAHSGGMKLHARLVDGRFPSWRSVIPASHGYELTLPVSDLSSALRQSQITTSEESRGVDFSFSEEGVSIESMASDVGRATIGLDAAIKAKEFTVDPRFMLDMLSRLPKDGTVLLQWTDGDSAVLLSDGDYRYVVMPLARQD